MRVALAVASAVVVLAGCGSTADPPAASALRGVTPAALRAERRAYDGAPPVVPHRQFSESCDSCHDRRGVSVPGVGFAPPSPHAKTVGMSPRSRCRQCHVERSTAELFRPSHFAARRPGTRSARAAFPGAPPVIPHPVFMRENCAACHTGPAAREQIRTSHPERLRCRQCHVGRRARGAFTVAG